ncbi:MAG: HK97 family phage prohead protease [Bacillota bacterium]
MTIKKTLNFEVKQVGNPEDRVLRFIGSSEAVDRDNDIIEVAGWQLDNYLNNPVFLWAHDYRQPPIGRAINVSKNLDAKQLVFDIKFATAEEYPFADTIYKLYLGGYMRATSVGFIPRKYKRRDDDAVLDKPEWQRGYRYVEQELLELSAVPVPSNPEALQIARSKGIDTTKVEEMLKPKYFQLRIDTNNKTIAIVDIKTGEDVGLVEASPEYWEKLTEPPEQKAGATLSAKNKQSLNQMMDCMRDMMGSAGMTPKGCPCGTCETKECPCNISDAGGDETEEGKTTENPLTVTVGFSEEFKQAIDSLKQYVDDAIKQVQETRSNDAPQEDEIDLDAIEIPKAADGDELNIEPESLKALLQEVVKEELNKARGRVN